MIMMLYKIFKKAAITRYFYFTYITPNSTGCLTMKNTQMPSVKEIIKLGGQDYQDANKCIVTGIYEFKSKEDYDDFKRE